MRGFELVLRDVLLATGVVLSAATQLRPGGLPVGPGEIVLLLWLGLSLCTWVRAPSLVINAPLLQLGCFWLVLAIALSIGAVVGFLVEPFHDYPGMLHDLVAYGLMMLVSCVLAVDLLDPARRRRVAWLVVLLGAAYGVAQIAHAAGITPLPFDGVVEPWFFNRFRGWSNDANQLGFLSAALVLLTLHLMEKALRWWETPCAILLGTFIAAIGVATDSDSFVISTLAGAAVFLTLLAPKWLARHGGGHDLRPAVVILASLALPVLLLSTIPLLPAITQRGEILTTDVYNKDGQGETRFKLWEESIEKGLESGLLGFGPGPHLTEKSWKRPPPDKFESHNVPLHLLTQGGVLAVTALLGLFACAFLLAMRASLAGLSALAVGFLVFSVFHFFIRHPIFWFGITLCLLEAAAVTRAAPAGRHAGPFGRLPIVSGARS